MKKVAFGLALGTVVGAVWSIRTLLNALHERAVDDTAWRAEDTPRPADPKRAAEVSGESPDQ